jgi:hypothetical protein
MTIDDRASRVVVVPLIASSLCASVRFVRHATTTSFGASVSEDDDPKTRSESVATESVHM